MADVSVRSALRRSDVWGEVFWLVKREEGVHGKRLLRWEKSSQTIIRKEVESKIKTMD